MKTLIIIVATVATSTLSVLAADNATLYSNASTSAANACGNSIDICPSCNEQNITDASNTSYTVYCDSVILSTERYAVTNKDAVKTPRLCMGACDEFSGCIGTYYSAGSCILAVGSFLNVVTDPGYTAFRRFAGPSAGAAPANSTTVYHTPSSSYHMSATTISASATSTSSSDTTSGCQASDISCPECDGKVVTDDRGQTYKVYCDNQLFADSDYSVQRWTSPSGCLLECDDYTWCKGATLHPQGNCELARGENVFPQEMPGYTAFSPVATGVPKAPPAHPSMYPTGAFTSATRMSSFLVGSSPASTQSGPATTQSPTGCHTASARCPECDGMKIMDSDNQTYVITCVEKPICEDIVNAGNASQAACLARCDADPICFAALWDTGHCDLCQGLVANFSAFDAPAAYVVFLWQLAANANATGTATISSTLASSASKATSTRQSTFSTSSRHSALSTSRRTTSTSKRTSSKSRRTTSTTKSVVPSSGPASTWTDSGMYAQTVQTASIPSSTGVSMSATLSSLPQASNVSYASTSTTTAAFVPPLTNGSVSYANAGRADPSGMSLV